jgi:urease accessory protein
MKRTMICAVAGAVLLLVLAQPAFAHHVMGGVLPSTFLQGLLSGLGHPVIGIDHLAAVVAVGCLAAAHRFGAALAVGFVLAMMLGVAVHVGEATLPASEMLAALAVVVLGGVLIRPRPLHPAIALVLFTAAGFLHGYALGESIVGAEPAPLLAYFVGLAVIQSAIALGALFVVRAVSARTEPALARLVGAGVAGLGFALLVQQLAPAA